ncbi:amidohydrolase family protein [Microbacterium album]|uniref:amidohydrolase family protein n=1 Tax=Microbacterium album TaxID=2053191 RepID=UPI00227CF1ED|nr:amidohydrolase family protein [Microbacterium album]
MLPAGEGAVDGAQRLIQGAVPPADEDTFRRAILVAMRALAAEGITSDTGPALGPGREGILGGAQGRSGIRAFNALASSVELPPAHGRPRGARRARGGSRGFPRGPADGDPGDRGASPASASRSQDLRRWRPGEPDGAHALRLRRDGNGSLAVGGDSAEAQEQTLRNMILEGHRADHQVAVHVTGDKATDIAVDAMIEAMRAFPRPDPRHYGIHADFVSDTTLARMAEWGIGANMNPTIKWLISDSAVENVGEELAAREWPYRSALRAGTWVTSASDAPVTAPTWRQAVATMMLREGRATGRVSGPEERIGLIPALRTYSTTAAYQDSRKTGRARPSPARSPTSA